MFNRIGVGWMVAIAAIVMVAGVEAAPPWDPGLSDRQLALQRWFSHLTFLADRKAQKWPEWFDDGKQFDNTSLRYQLAFSGYACVSMAAHTPAYRELVSSQLRDLIERMIDRRVWFYVTHYWKYGAGAPDPCQFENVMYTAHLTQLICLYEHMTGDMRYSRRGWDFVWQDGRKVHYTLDKAVRRLYAQSLSNPSGGICCEPGLIFADCNTHSSTTYMLHDLLHSTQYTKVNAKWFDWMSKRFRNRMPGAGSYLYIVYKVKDNMFLPAGDAGADAWALGWGHPWFPDAGYCGQGWKFLLENATWTRPAADQMHSEVNPVVGCCGKFNAGVANAFLALMGAVAEGKDGANVRKILNWMDARFGKAFDMDGDGHAESYAYHTCEVFRIPATANVATALSTDGDSMKTLYRTPRKDLWTAPTLAHVDYPNIYVRAAEYVAPTLRFVVVKGRPAFSGKTKLICSNIPAEAKVTRDGKPFDVDRDKTGGVIIGTDADTEHVFEITE